MKTLVNRQESSLGKFATPINSERQLMFGSWKGLTIENCIRSGNLGYIEWCVDNVKGFVLNETESRLFSEAEDSYFDCAYDRDSSCADYLSYVKLPTHTIPDRIVRTYSGVGMCGAYDVVEYASGRTETTYPDRDDNDGWGYYNSHSWRDGWGW